MIEQIIGTVVVPLLESLTWADQIGWMVTPYTKRVEVRDGQFADKIIPVAKNVTIDGCATDYNGLNVMTTDKSYASLMLISAEGDMSSTAAENIPKRRAINIEQDFSVNVWMNDHQGMTHVAKAEVIKTLFNIMIKQQAISWTVLGVTDADFNIYVNKMKIRFVREIEGNPFAEYSFADDQAQFINQYAAFGLVFKLTALVFPDCFPASPVLNHSACDAPIATYVVDDSLTKIIDG